MARRIRSPRAILVLGLLIVCSAVFADPMPGQINPASSADPSLPPQLPVPSIAGGSPEEVIVPAPASGPAVERIPAPGEIIDPQTIARGESAFQRSCTTCHDAEKSFAKRKSFTDWSATVRRMAEKQGADVAGDDVTTISLFLSVKCGIPEDGPPGPGLALQRAFPTLSFYGTVSPTWRGGSSDLQNPGFWPDLWIGVTHNDPSSPISVRATACTACHSDGGMGSRIELVEAVVRFDFAKAVGCTRPQLKAAIEAGRILVPFGAFSSQSNPGVYRTVSRPLIFNMGQRVLDGVLGDPVLPMPYADEGAMANFAVPVWNDIIVAADAYIVNGLQGGLGGIDFDLSRDYVDNNTTPAGGGRLTIGNQYLRIGSSVMGGQHSPTGLRGPTNNTLGYFIYGFDATFHYQDIFRLQFEYARRITDQVVNPGGGDVTAHANVGGYYLESEWMFRPRVSVLGRYDFQFQNSFDTGRFNVSRATFGLNFTLIGGSLLMINQEEWFLPGGLPTLGVTGVRWAYTF